MTAGVERTLVALPVTHWMRRITISTGHPTARQWLRCSMCPAACEELWQNMRMWPLRTRAVGRWNSLKYFDAAHAADKNTMRVGAENNSHGAAICCEHRFSHVTP